MDKRKEGGEIVFGAEECYKHTVELLEEMGFPKGVMPMKNLEECGIVKETGFVWMKQKEPFEHFFERTDSLVRYSREVTAYVEKKKMKKMSGVKSRELLLWVPLSEMSIDDPEGLQITFKTSLGIGRSFPRSAFNEEDENLKQAVMQM